jgi:hypothetical protein
MAGSGPGGGWWRSDPVEARRSEHIVSALDQRPEWERRGFKFAPPWEHPSRRWVVTAPDGTVLEYGGREADRMMSDLELKYPLP